jgi:hypothetical protein
MFMTANSFLLAFFLLFVETYTSFGLVFVASGLVLGGLTVLSLGIERFVKEIKEMLNPSDDLQFVNVVVNEEQKSMRDNIIAKQVMRVMREYKAGKLSQWGDH